MERSKQESRNKKSGNIFFKFVIYSGFTIIFLFTLYEYKIVKNPFMDPVPAYILWFGIFIVSVLLIYRINQALSDKNRV